MREKLIKKLRDVAELKPPICPYDQPSVVVFGKVVETIYCKPFEDFQTLAREAADALETPTWISVKERLPSENGRYLCNVKSFAFKDSFYTTILGYDKGGFIEGHIYTDDVTHWMPLPEPSKGE